MVEIDTAAGAQALAVFRTQGFCIHLQNEHRFRDIQKIDSTILQKEDLIVVLILQLVRHHGFIVDALGIFKLLQAAVADGIERGRCRKLQEKHPRDIPHIAGYHNRLLHGIPAAEVHIGQIHVKLELYLFSGGVDDLLNI